MPRVRGKAHALTPETAIARHARAAADVFASTSTAADVAEHAGARVWQLIVFEDVVTMVLDATSASLASELACQAPQLSADDAAELAVDFLAAWATNRAEATEAGAASDTRRLTELVEERDRLIKQLIHDTLSAPARLRAVRGGKDRR